MTTTPNTPQELVDLQKSQVELVLEDLSELNLWETHQVVRFLLSHLKDRYGDFYENTEDNQFLWDGCKVGTCLQVFNSLKVFQEEREQNNS